MMLKPPVKEEIMELPFWVIMALTTRCAMRVQPLYQLPVGRGDIRKHVRAIDEIIKLLGKSASNAVWDKGIIAARNSANDAYLAAGSAYPDIPLFNTTNTTRDIKTMEDIVAHAVAGIVVNIIACIDCDIDIVLDYQHARDTSTINKWTDDTPVNYRNFFGTLWRGEAPDWFVDGCNRQKTILGYAPCCADEED